MELLAITLMANETKQFAKAGRYFEIVDSSYPITVNFSGANGALSDSMVNALSGLYLEDAYSHFSITNSSIAQTVQLLLMETGRGGSRRQPGNVRVIDSNTDKTRSGFQYLGSTASGPNAGVNSACGLRCEGMNLAIKRMIVGSAVAGQIMIFRGSSPGPTLSPGGVLQNKNFNSPNSSANLAGGSCVAVPPTAVEQPGYVPFVLLTVNANQPVEVPLTTPLILTGTQVLGVVHLTQNSNVVATFDVETFT